MIWLGWRLGGRLGGYDCISAVLDSLEYSYDVGSSPVLTAQLSYDTDY